MAKKNLKRGLALGALMAFVITGSAMAAEINSKDSVAVGEFKNDTFTLGSDSVTLNGMPSGNAGIGDSAAGSQNTMITISDGQTLTLNTTNAQEYGMIQNTIINSDGALTGTVVLNHSGSVFGAAIGTNHSGGNNVTINANEIKIDAAGVFALYATNPVDKINLNANKISMSSQGTAVYAANGSVDIKATESLVISSDKRAILSNVNGQVDIGSAEGVKADIVINGNIDYYDQGNSEANGGIVNISLETENSALNGAIKPYAEGSKGNATLGLSDGATWNVTGDSNVHNLNVNGGVIDLNKNVTVGTLAGSEMTVNATSFDNAIEANNNSVDNVTINASAAMTDALAKGEASTEDALNVVTRNNSGSVTFYGAASDVAGATTITSDANGNVTRTEATNTANAAVSDMASISMMTWRQENNDMNKRLGELRDSKGQYGAWARMARGESKYGAQGVKNQYNYYQIGYDEKLSTDPHWTVGVALTRTEGNSTFKDGSGENNHTGVAVYGSYLGENGSFIDLIAKYSRMDNEYKTTAGVGDADYKTNGYSVSAEYGKRFTKDNGLWIEPQVELTYGTVGSANYMTSKDASVRQDGIDSLVGRVGFALGKNIKAGNVYARASYLYDFDGEANVTYSKSGVTRSFEQDLGGGWWEVGIGSNINLSNATHLYFDVEKTYGGDVATPWQWNVGVRYSF